MKTLTIEDFELEQDVAFPGRFMYSFKDGKGLEICLEACTEGLCVGAYRNGDIVVDGEKLCTEMSDTPIGFLFEAGRPPHVMEKALGLANQLYQEHHEA